MATNDLLTESTIRTYVGAASFARGQAYASKKLVKNLQWDKDESTLSGEILGSYMYHTDVTLRRNASKMYSIASSDCSCPVGVACKHVAALLLAGRHLFARAAQAQEAGLISGSGVGATAEWQRDLLPFLAQTPDGRRATGTHLGLQFELTEQYIYRTDATTGLLGGGKRLLLGVRPVYRQPVDGDRWKMSQLTWQQISRSYTYLRDVDPEQLRWLHDLHTMYAASFSSWYDYARWLLLDFVTTEALWAHLEKGRSLGIAMITAEKSQPALKILQPATAAIDITKTPEGNLTLAPTIRQNGTILSGKHHGFIGDSQAVGIYLWQMAGNVLKTASIAIAPFDRVPAKPLQAMLERGQPTIIPRADIDTFNAMVYPRLVQQVPIMSADKSVELPEITLPTLLVDVKPTNNALALKLYWRYRVGGKNRTLALYPTGKDAVARHDTSEQQTVQSAAKVLQPYPSLWEATDGLVRLAEHAKLSGMEAVGFVENGLDALRAVPEVEVNIDGTLPDYRELTAPPEIIISTKDGDDRDWFDLHVQVKLDGQEIPFDVLLIALASNEPYLVLDDGRYFELGREEFSKLRSLIEEARQLQDVESDGLKISRFQAGLWEELQELGVVDEQAAAWRLAVEGLLHLESIDPVTLPKSVDVTLRPYQQAGYQWLHFLWQHQLGGILADDMGLGKTIQTICLIAKVVESNPNVKWLVIAPTSVAGNWQQEIERFAPHLTVSVLAETSKKRGQPLAKSIERSNVVITSYAIMRFDEDEFQSISWEGVILDEAQFIKNHQSKSYQVARKLQARIKLGLTGTPIENNLMELWALLSVVAPGLFASPKHFNEFYQRPIARDNDAQRMQQLKRRIRPLLLRRTKQEVMADLPPKIEQTLLLNLLPSHQKVYDIYLQRERQRVLGLLGDLQKNRFAIFKSLTTLRMLSLDARLIDAKKYKATDSTKLESFIEQVAILAEEGHRVLVFSQFTTYLNLVRERLDALGYAYCYLDGRSKDRARIVREFREGEAPLFLISLKAGGFGLNLTEADYCFILDPWWNPAVEAQAVDRTHRIGQTKTVSVYRLIAKGTIEEKVVALRQKKAKLFNNLMDADGQFSEALSADDIRGLFE